MIFIHFYKWYLSLSCCFSEHIVTCYTWYVILILLCIFCHHFRVCILLTDLSRTVNVTGNFIFFTYTNGICHVFVVLVNIMPPVIHDLLSSYPCASFATIPVSISQLQTSVTREMSREMWLWSHFPWIFSILEKSVIKIETREWWQKMRKSLRIAFHVEPVKIGSPKNK